MRISASTAFIFAAALAFGAVLVSAANPAQPASRRAADAMVHADEGSGTSRTVIGLHVPWAVGGLRIERDGSLRQHPGEWPTIPVHSLRLWDTRTAWLNLEPAQDQWEFGQLDAQIAVARAHAVKDITLVLWGTPGWAASSLDEDDASWLGPGAAAMPRNINDWREFVAKVAARYRGVITAYEIGNEPEDRKFWRGTPQQFAQMVSTAASTIHETDPGAVVVAPATLMAMEEGAAGIRDQAPPGWAAEVDALAFHWYPRTSTSPRRLNRVVTGLRARMKALGLGGMNLWLTEVNYRGARVSATRERALVRGTNEEARRLRLERVYWYAWTDLGPPELLQLQPGTPAEAALRASSEQIASRKP